MTSIEPVFEFTDPADNGRVWFMDLIHSPRALPPLCGDRNARMGEFTPLGLEGRSVNGYYYNSPKSMAPPPPMPELAPGEALTRWQTVHLVETRGVYERFRDQPYATMTANEVLAFIDANFSAAGLAFGNTIVSAMEVGPEAERLADLLEAKLGEQGGLLAATLLHGSGSQTRNLGHEVQALAEAAGASAGVADALKARDLRAAASSAAEPWASALRAFLADHEDEIALWTELHEPAWSEDPAGLMRMVAATIEAPGGARDDAGADAVAQVRAKLAAEDLPAFEAAFAESKNYVSVIEHRARWQLKLAGGLRKAYLAVGAKLAEQRKLAAANDVFFLYHDEIAAAIAGSIDSRALTAQRRAEWEHQLTLTPPMSLGLPVPYEMMGAVSPMLRRMFGAVALSPATKTTVTGIAASAGVARGRARVVLSLNDADDLQDGDILVCPSTSPPWSPYFAIVSAIVTDGGGVISHAAIESREYGIPSVVGTRVGTRTIPDGAMITVDGAAGTVTIEA